MRDVYAVCCPDGENVAIVYRDAPGLAARIADDEASARDKTHGDCVGPHRVFVSSYWQEEMR